MTRGTRISVLVLGLAAAAGWALGAVLLPLAAWAAMEGAVELGRRLGEAHRLSRDLRGR
jgi:hypothetical protein